MCKVNRVGWQWYAIAFLAVLSMLLAPATALFAQAGPITAGSGEVPALVTDLYESPYEPYIYMDEISRMLRERDSSKASVQAAEVADAGASAAEAALIALMDQPYYPYIYMDEIARLTALRDGNELSAFPSAWDYYPYTYMQEIERLTQQRDGSKGVSP